MPDNTTIKHLLATFITAYILFLYIHVNDLQKETISVKTSQKHAVVVNTTIQFQWMFTKLYINLKTIDNLKCKI